MRPAKLLCRRDGRYRYESKLELRPDFHPIFGLEAALIDRSFLRGEPPRWPDNQVKKIIKPQGRRDLA